MLLSSVSLHPDSLDVGTADDVVPLGIRATVMFLGWGSLSNGIHEGVWEFVHHVFPDTAGLFAQVAKNIADLLKGCFSSLGVVDRFPKDLLLRPRGDCTSNEEGKSERLHCRRI
ncbi:predicted protein [Histoplasma capsulatum H143]|uniref:Uncharacterized protein n=1 Tax=Ajellomyces capsulatus (strain H143) TaxID=544712 RepID=C6HI25_AJECH|nr:predicted protein [Histoplasma capsulatum H143]